MNREDILKSFNDVLWRKLEASKGDTADLDPLEYAAVCLMNFQCEVNNGGLHTYFYNSSGYFARDTPDVMRHIGAPQAALILDEANALFGADGPSRDREQRIDQLEALGEQRNRMENLTQQFFAAEDDGLSLADLFDDYVISCRSPSAS